MFKKVFLIILDSVGLKAAPDAEEFGDLGAATLLHIYQETDMELPNLERMGLSKLIGKTNVDTRGIYGTMLPESSGKDTIAGHWEMMGIVLKESLPTYPNGFPSDIVDELEKAFGRKILANRTASGTVIIKELGQEHIHSGKPIVYTSADSVMQIAAHEKIIPYEKLHELCKKARKIMTGKNAVGRIVARPFIGDFPSYVRTPNRKDFALEPDGLTVLDLLYKNDIQVVSVGKIADIFANRGIHESIKINDNDDGMEKINQTIEKLKDNTFLFANLNDFDSKYGHRRDVEGYKNALIDFDNYLPSLLELISKDDLLIITADHGNDPTFKGTDHTREIVPLLIYNDKKSLDIGQVCFKDLGATILDNFEIKAKIGNSFLDRVCSK